MKPVLTEETWRAIDEFFRQTPEASGKLTSWQEVIAESERRAALRTQQQTLIHLLRHKFHAVPHEIEQRIEATEDTERLSAWLDPLLDADMLVEVERVLEVEKTHD